MQPEEVKAIAEAVAPLVLEQMHRQVHVEGLLHLGALSVAVLLAYLGLDRLKKLEDPIGKEMDEFSKDTHKLLSDRDYVKDGAYSGPEGFAERPQLQLLCYMAGVTGIKWPRFSKWRLLRLRGDRWIIGVLAAFSVSAFILLVSGTLFPGDIDFTEERWFLDSAFTLFIAQLAWVFTIIMWARGLAARLSSLREVELNSLQKTVASIGDFHLLQELKKQAGASLLCPANAPDTRKKPPADCKGVVGDKGRSYDFCPSTGQACPQSV